MVVVVAALVVVLESFEVEVEVEVEVESPSSVLAPPFAAATRFLRSSARESQLFFRSSKFITCAKIWSMNGSTLPCKSDSALTVLVSVPSTPHSAPSPFSVVPTTSSLCSISFLCVHREIKRATYESVYGRRWLARSSVPDHFVECIVGDQVVRRDAVSLADAMSAILRLKKSLYIRTSHTPQRQRVMVSGVPSIAYRIPPYAWIPVELGEDHSVVHE